MTSLIEKVEKKQKLVTICVSFLVLFCFAAQTYVAEINIEYVTDELSLPTMVVGLVIGIAVATRLLPTIFNSTAVLELDTAGDLDTNEESLISTWNIIIIAAIMLAIISFAM